MLSELYDAVGGVLLVCGGIGLVLGINSGIRKSGRSTDCTSERYTVDVEITDPMLVSEIQTLKQLQEVYNAQIVQQQDKRITLEHKLLDIILGIDDQRNEMEYMSHLGDAKINELLYKSKIEELSESEIEIRGRILHIEEKIIKLTGKSDGITAKLNAIALSEYKHQNQ